MNTGLRDLSAWMGDTQSRSGRTIVEVFCDHVSTAGDAVALDCPSGTSGAKQQTVTYADLLEMATALARHLVLAGVRQGDCVLLATGRGADPVVGMLGILLAGGAYVPVDPALPPGRQAFMAEDCGARLLVRSAGVTLKTGLELTELEIGGAAPAGAAEVTLPQVGPDDPAYVIYTSGSTGRPKGVITPHRAVLRLTQNCSYTPLTPGRRVLQMAPQTFDAATFEIWGPLLNGGTCVIYPGSGLPDPAVLRRVLAESRVQTIWLTSSLFNAIIDEDMSILSGIEELLVGGEALSVRHVRRALNGLQAQLVNGYGPTETTTFACCYRIPRDLSPSVTEMPIGLPIQETAVAVLDENLLPVAPGEVGELCIAGPGLALGYLGQPELTAERFAELPWAPGGRAYRTGDLARIGEGGLIQYLGRRDLQVKISGHRIELGEVEAVLRGIDGIADAAAGVVPAPGGDKRLAAWVVAEPGQTVDPTSLRSEVAARLPKYMVPAVFVPLDAMPLTENGKLNRKALALPEAKPTGPAGPNRSESETIVAAMWRDLLGVEHIDRDARFFEIGGTSLLAMRFLQRLKADRGIELSVAAFFDGPTVRAVARSISGEADLPVTDAALASDTDRAAGNAKIAIVGLGGRFAGAPDVPHLWEMLLDGRSGRIEVTAEDMIASGEDPALLEDPDYVAAAFPLDDVENYDAAFFGFTPREVELMDPQQRVLLEVAWTTLEDAGIDTRRSGDRVGVFTGVGRNAYLLSNLMSHPALRESAHEYNMLIGNERDFPSTHIAYRLGLHGPAMTVQTACSTSGVAIHMAAEALRRGECDLALAGGAKVLVPNRAGYHYTEGGPLAPDGQLRAFDADARGMVRGSGAAMIALKRLDKALEDGDHVYAVLIGSAINNDGGDKAGFTAPSVTGQAEVISGAYRAAGISADSVQLIEAHGTGTELGDPIEVEGLSRAFRQTTALAGYCALGSIKTNIGHLDAGATAAGLIKAALSLQNEAIPPSLNFSSPNPKIGFEGSPFYVPTTPTPWPRGNAPRRAGISSFGLGGTNVHLLIEEAPVRDAGAPMDGPHLLVLSAKTETALARRCSDLADWLEAHPGADLASVAQTLLIGRRRFDCRTAVVATTAEDAIARLRSANPRDRLRGQVKGAERAAFLFPGGGAQYAGMGLDLYDSEPAFREAIDACEAHLTAIGGPSILGALRQDAPLEAPATALPALFAVNYAVAQLWLSRGVEPAAMLGHSVGEYAAACIAGVMSLEDALSIVLTRGRLFETLPAGAMLSVPLAADAVEGRRPEGVSIAAINRPDSTVVSGSVEAIDALAAAFAADGIETRKVHIDVAAHSPMLDPILDDFRAAVAQLTLNPPQRRFLSNHTGDWITDAEATDPDYWVRHLRGTVRYADGVARLFEDPDLCLIETGPGQTLSGLARQHPARGAGHEVIASMRHPQEAVGDAEALTSAIGRFWLAGGEMDWVALTGGLRPRLPLPTYAFDRQRYWVDPLPFEGTTNAAPVAALSAPAAEAAPAPVDPHLPRKDVILARITQIIHDLSGLPMDRIDPFSTFLELGFDSLFLTQANAAFRKAFKVKLTTRQLLETLPVIDQLASYLDEQMAEGASIEAPAAAAAAPRAAAPKAEESPGRPTIRTGASAALTPEQERHIDELILDTVARTPKAKAQVQDHRHVLADPRTVQGFRQRWKEMVYPVLSDDAKGAHVWDIDGNRYVDLVGGYGVTFLGHAPEMVMKAMRRQMDRSMAIGPQTPLAGETAQIVSELTGMERVAFCNTGSEAVLAGVRMARTVTGRSKVVKFDGHYHGIFDEMQVRGSGQGSRMTTLPSAPGIPEEAIQNTIIVSYGDPDALNVIREQAGDIAVVLVEPVRSRNPDYQPREYLHELRRVTKELDIPLLFDEMVTGFRSHPGGAQHLFGIRADIATYGKVAGGGLPIGIVAGSAQYMDSLDGGMWEFGDDSAPPADMTWFAGTFVRHPLALAAANATLTYLKEQGPALQEGLNARSAALASELNAICRRYKAPIKVERFASVLRLTFTAHQEYSDLLFFHMRNRGILTYEGRPIFLTTAHSQADFAQIVRAFEESLGSLVRVGLMDGVDPNVPRVLPMTTGQQEIWVTSEFGPEANCSYNLCSTLELTGALSIEVLESALDDLADRHEALRAVPGEDGQTQTIRPQLDVPFELFDLVELEAEAREALLEELKQSEVRQPFDLRQGPLVRATLVRMTPERHILLLTVHHVIADGWSCGVLLRDLGELYAARREGREAKLPDPQQLSDFVAYLEQPEQQAARAEARDYWVKLYEEGLSRVVFPSDRQRQKSGSLASRRFQAPVPKELDAGLRKLAKAKGTTLFAALIGGFSAYLTRLTGVADNAVGFSAAGQPLLGGSALVGHCVNFLPLRLSADMGMGYGPHLKRIGDSVLDALENQNFDFVSFVQEVQPSRSADGVPIVTIGVNLDPSSKGVGFGDLGVVADSVGRAYERMDMFLNFVEADDRLLLQCTYNTALFDADTISKRMDEYLQLMQSGLDAPDLAMGELALMSEAEHSWVATGVNDTDRPHPRDVSLAEQFRRTAARLPGKAALVIPSEDGTASPAEVSYAELDRLSDLWAARLQSAGVQRGDFVTVILHRSVDFVAGVLATLKCGAAYVPVEPGTPGARTTFLVEDSRSRAVLAHSDLTAGLETGGATLVLMDHETPRDAVPVVVEHDPDDAAYMMYTSGTTGTPKGVVVPHRGVSRLFYGNDYARIDETRIIAQMTAVGFDLSIYEVWSALAIGGALMLPLGDGMIDLTDLKRMYAETRTNALMISTSIFNAIVDEDPSILAPVEEVIVVGEAMSVPHVRRAYAALPGITIINGYGPTECTVIATAYRIPRDLPEDCESILIGTPVTATTAYIMDAEQRLLPQGVPGELVLGGDGVASGYWQRPEKTAEAFVPDTVGPGPSARLYRTGDICRLGPDGRFEYVGRHDNQVKVRGVRIELGEVEAALARTQGVKRSAILFDKETVGGRLVGFVVPSEAGLTDKAIIARMRDRLPRHAVPSRIVVLDALPMNKNGKLDRKALAAMIEADREVALPTEATTATETELLQLWSDILARPVDGVDRDFFDLGGHSLLAVRLVNQIRRNRGLVLPISALITHPTVRDLAELVDSMPSGSTGNAEDDPDAGWDPTVVVEAGPGGDALPLFVIGGAGGNLNNLIDMTREIGRKHPVIGFQSRGILGHRPHGSIEEMATDYIRHLRRHQPKGPYRLLGYSAGGLTAFEMARQLEAAGEEVADLVLLDRAAPEFLETASSAAAGAAGAVRKRLRHEIDLWMDHGGGQFLERLGYRFSGTFLNGRLRNVAGWLDPAVKWRIETMENWYELIDAYRGGAYGGTLTLVVSLRDRHGLRQVLQDTPLLGWDRLIPKHRITRHDIDSTHQMMVHGKDGGRLARIIDASLTRLPTVA